jgi:hypothetical protein
LSEADIQAELESHLRMQTAEHIRRGLTPGDARRQALLAAGGLANAAESVREQYRVVWLEQAIADLRYGVRALRRNPGFTVVAITTLALGIGANATIFSVLRGLLLRPLPYASAERLAIVWTDDPARGLHELGTSYPTVQD